MDLSYPLIVDYRWAGLLFGRPNTLILDQDGHTVFYCEQKRFSVRRCIYIYDNPDDKTLLYYIKANGLFDSTFTIFTGDKKNTVLGTIHDNGLISLLQPTYTIFDANGEKLFLISASIIGLRVVTEVIDSKSMKVLMNYNVNEFKLTLPSINRIDTHLSEKDELLAIFGILLTIEVNRGR